MPLFMIDCIFIDRDIEFITYGINHKSLRPTLSISSLVLLRRGMDLQSRGAEPGIEPWGPALQQKLMHYYLSYAAPYYFFCMKYPVSLTEKTYPVWCR